MLNTLVESEKENDQKSLKHNCEGVDLKTRIKAKKTKKQRIICREVLASANYST